ncbi:MAG: pantoate kinase [Nanoarchaeota archaeon]
MNSAKVFAPANISCIFVIKKTKNPAKSGSLGMGFTINKGVIVTIKKLYNNNKSIKKISDNHDKKNKNRIYFNGKKFNFPTVNSVLSKLTDEKVVVDIKSDFPLGMGFGISGAAALATAYSLNKLFNLGKSKKQLAMIAHIAEVENSTGLGDVVNQYFGGFLAKYESSYKFRVNKLPIKNKAVYCRYFSPIETKEVISDEKIKNRINNAGINALNKIKALNNKNTNLKNIIKISKEFSINSGLLKNKKIINLIKHIEKNNGNASMIMLGNAVFSDIKFKGSKKLIIKDKGAYLL